MLTVFFPANCRCRVEALADGWCNLRLRAADAAKHRQLKQDCPSNTGGGWAAGFSLCAAVPLSAACDCIQHPSNHFPPALPAVVVLTESRPPVRGAIEWAAAQVSATSRANCGASGRAAKRQRRTPEAAQEASAPSASVDSSGAAGGRSELDATADSSAAAAAGGSNGGAACTASPAGRVVAGLVRRGRDAELVLQVRAPVGVP